MSSDLYLKQMELGPMANFVYLIGSRRTHEAAVVDPAWDVRQILEVAAEDEMRIKHLIITHSHPDHINGVEEMLHRTDAQVYLHKAEAEFHRAMWSNMVKTDGGDTLRLGDLTITFVHTPGHTPGSQCFAIDDKLVSGDTLFIGSCGRTDFPGGDAATMYQTLTRVLAKFDDTTWLYPGHNYADVPISTLGYERRTNPTMQFADLQSFLRVMGRPGSVTLS
ncbi:MAG: MBL fold metallo-hydrolase [Candidatus Tectomicrobia bacterium]|nr:MBL fold metallo-hydrolase [Candidatus Tectomicrobia bacterium]